MRHATAAIGMATALIAAASATAQTGAPAGAAMQPGAWGSQGWQPGGSVPAYPAPVAPVAQPYAPAPGYGAPTYGVPAYGSPAYGSPAYGAPGYAAAPGYGPAYGVTTYPATAADPRRRPLIPGRKLKGGYRDPRYTVADPARYGLPAPGPRMRWVRYFDDAVLVDASNRIVDARGNIDWSGRPRTAPRATAAGVPAPATSMAPVERRTVTRTGPHTLVTTVTRTETVPGGYDPAVYGAGASFTPGTRTTVTTTTEDTRYTSRPARTRRSAWRR